MGAAQNSRRIFGRAAFFKERERKRERNGQRRGRVIGFVCVCAIWQIKRGAASMHVLVREMGKNRKKKRERSKHQMRDKNKLTGFIQ